MKKHTLDVRVLIDKSAGSPLLVSVNSFNLWCLGGITRKWSTKKKPSWNNPTGRSEDWDMLDYLGIAVITLTIAPFQVVGCKRSPGWCRGFAWWLVGKRNNKNVLEVNLITVKKSQKHKISHLPGLEACQLSLNPFCKGCDAIIDRIKKSVQIIFWYPKLDKRRPKQCHKWEFNKWLSTSLLTHLWLGYHLLTCLPPSFLCNQVTCNFQKLCNLKQYLTISYFQKSFPLLTCPPDPNIPTVLVSSLRGLV